MKWGCCGTIDQHAAIEAAGCDYVEPKVLSLQTDAPDLPAEILEAFEATNLEAECFNVFVPSTLPIVGPEVDNDALAHHVETAAERATSLGAQVIVFGSGGARWIPDGYSETTAHDQVLAFLDLVADIFAPRALTLAIEPIKPPGANCIHTVAEAYALAAEIDHPQIQILADLRHMAGVGDPIDSLGDVADRLWHVHVPAPGQAYPHGEFLAQLKSIGYDRRISVEDNLSDFKREVGPVINQLKSLWRNA